MKKGWVHICEWTGPEIGQCLYRNCVDIIFSNETQPNIFLMMCENQWGFVILIFEMMRWVNITHINKMWIICQLHRKKYPTFFQWIENQYCFTVTQCVSSFYHLSNSNIRHVEHTDIFSSGWTNMGLMMRLIMTGIRPTTTSNATFNNYETTLYMSQNVCMMISALIGQDQMV